jgi:hypothetical protein
MSTWEWLVYTRLNKVLKLGYSSVAISYDGARWVVTAMSRGDIQVLATSTRLRRALREALD